MGSLPSSLPSGNPFLRKPSFLGEDSQFLATDSWLEAPENPQSAFIGRNTYGAVFPGGSPYEVPIAWGDEMCLQFFNSVTRY